MTHCIAGIQYLPSVEYFAHWIHHDHFIIEQHENYQKRTWRNKTCILGPHHPVPLSVPLRKGKNNQMSITKVEISYDEHWTRNHINSIQTIYGKTAFYNELEEGINLIYKTKPKYLWELNLQFIQFILLYIPLERNIEYTNSHLETLPEAIVDIRQGVPAGQTSISNSILPEYQQIQRLSKSHLPNLSIVDVLCHLGPATLEYLTTYAAALYN